MTAVLPSLRRGAAALLLALAAPGALVVALAISDDDEPTANAAPDATEEAAATPGETPAGDSVEPGDDAPAAADDAAMPADPDEKPAADTSPPAEPEQGAATEPKNPPSGPHRPSLAREKATANTKYSLAYKFKPGEVIRWEVVHRAVVDTTIQGTNQTAETRSTSIKAWQVNDVSSEGNVTLVHLVESIDMWQKMQGRQEVRYNSRTDDKVPPGYEDIAKAVGVPLTLVTFDAHGNVLKREEKHRQSNTSNMPLAIPLPAEPVPVGHTWSVPSDVDVILHGGATRKIQTRQNFVLEKVAGGVATIAMETQVLTPLNDPAIEAQLVQRFTNGTLRFDMASGRVVSQQLDLDRKVVGFSGTSSSMHYLTRFTEELLTDNSPVAYKKPPKTAPATGTAPQPPAPPVTAKAPAKPRARPARR
ncbi:MAG TPA: hypothetical protein VHY91_20880 [Pirellulales bacterium]|jgi:hypothetical protein|nr:hypothetical protein [Pirellulales bacterium]